MPNFSPRPNAGLSRSGYRLLRTPAARPLQAYVISDNLTGCNTHFIANRTIPCEAPNCEACDAGIGWRWHGYLLCLVEATQETILFEITARASAAFIAYYERHGTLRGAHFKAQRANNKDNGRILLQVKPADLARVKLPDEQPVEQLLCHIWNIPPNQIDTPPEQTRPPFKHTRVDRQQPELPEPASIPDPFNHPATLPMPPKGNNRKHPTPTG